MEEGGFCFGGGGGSNLSEPRIDGERIVMTMEIRKADDLFQRKSIRKSLPKGI